MWSSRPDFFQLTLYLFDEQLWLQEIQQTNIGVHRASAMARMQIRELEEMGFQFEPPFAEDSFPCLTI